MSKKTTAATTANGDRVLMEWETGRELMRVTLGEFKGEKRIDFRRYWDNDGEWAPSQKGAAVPLEMAEELIAVLQAEVDHA